MVERNIDYQNRKNNESSTKWVIFGEVVLYEEVSTKEYKSSMRSLKRRIAAEKGWEKSRRLKITEVVYALVFPLKDVENKVW